MKSPTLKGNPNLLYSNFRNIEHYNSPSETKKQRGTPKQPKLILSAKKDEDKERLLTCSSKNEFEELPLDAQIAELLKPIVDAAELINKTEYEEHSSLAFRDSIKSGLKPIETDLDFTAITKRNVQPEDDQQGSDDKASLDPKGSVSLPPIKGYDPFTSNKVVKHWHYHQPVKYNAINARNNSINASSVTEVQRKSSTEAKISKDYASPVYKNLKARANIKPLSALDIVPASKSDRPREYYMAPLGLQSAKNTRVDQIDIVQKGNLIDSLPNIKQNNPNSELLGEMNSQISSEDLISSKKVNRLQNASNEANHLLQGSLNSEKLNKLSRNLLEVNQAKSQRLLADANKRFVEMSGMQEDFSTNGSGIDHQRLTNREIEEIKALSPRASFKSPEKSKKTEYYNKWYVPVKSWSVTKDTNTMEKKYEQLKKDINFYYHNIHDYSSFNPKNPLKDKGLKNPQQLNYESLQEKLKQNMTIRKYKKQLIDNHLRVPSFLKTIDE